MLRRVVRIFPGSTRSAGLELCWVRSVLRWLRIGFVFGDKPCSRCGDGGFLASFRIFFYLRARCAGHAVAVGRFDVRVLFILSPQKRAGRSTATLSTKRSIV